MSYARKNRKRGTRLGVGELPVKSTMDQLGHEWTIMNYYPRHIGDYARDAGHLSLAEHGAYTLLLDRYYATERPIGREEAFRICRARSKVDRAAVAYVLETFFLLTNAGYQNKRADEEIFKAREKSEKARASVNSRWNQSVSKKEGIRSYNDRNAVDILSNNQKPITNNQGASAGYSRLSGVPGRKVGTSRISEEAVLNSIGQPKGEL